MPPMQERTRKTTKTSSQLERPEEQLALREEALAVTAEGVTISDAALPDNPIIYANRGFERLTGYSVEDVVGRNCRFLQGVDTAATAVAEIRKSVREGRECTVQLLNYRKDGSPFWNRLSITPLRDEAGQVTHFVGVQSDVTDQKRGEAALSEANQRLKAVNQRMARDLEAAAEIQRSLLPSSSPIAPGIEFSWCYRPCDELAGDIFNTRMLEEGQIALYVIDVSGHGVAAALFAVTLSRLLSASRSESGLPKDDGESPQNNDLAPARLAEELNLRFPFDQHSRQYFTMLYGVLDTRTHQFRYVSAGHPGPIVVPLRGHPRDLSSSGFPIGLIQGATYQERVVYLRPGDRLFLITDGLVEAENTRRREFGMDRVLQQLRDSREQPLTEATTELVRQVENWCGDVGMQDDASVLACEVSANAE